MYDSKHRTTDTQIYETRKEGSGYSSSKREWNLQTHGFNDETANHRKYIRTQSSSNSRVPSSSSSQQQRQNGEKKAVKDTKKPLRVSGDWSEFKSSTGKTYFYNCKTEISQWEKPKGWSSEEPSRTSSSTDRIKKESASTNISPTVRSRYKMEESSSQPKSSQIPHIKSTSEYPHNHQNGHHLLRESTEHTSLIANNRLPSPDDNSSRMSFSSTSSKESALVLPHSNENATALVHSSLAETAISVSTPVPDVPSKALDSSINGNDGKPSNNRSILPPLTNTDSTHANENESTTAAITKAEREHEIQKFYRAELIQHLTDWPSTQLEKQCLKLFDDYYGYSAKMSTAFTELKALKSNFRVLEIKRNILTQRLLRCQQHARDREEDKYS